MQGEHVTGPGTHGPTLGSMLHCRHLEILHDFTFGFVSRK